MSRIKFAKVSYKCSVGRNDDLDDYRFEYEVSLTAELTPDENVDAYVKALFKRAKTLANKAMEESVRKR